MRPLRLFALLALPLFALGACDSNSDDTDKACYGSGSDRVCLTATDTVVGTGVAAAKDDSVFVRYVGRVRGNGDAEFDRGAFGFPLRPSAVIPGFYYGIAGANSEDLSGLTATIDAMKVGGKRTVTIPAALAYGDREIRDNRGFLLIPRNSDLVFEIELTGVR